MSCNLLQKSRKTARSASKCHKQGLGLAQRLKSALCRFLARQLGVLKFLLGGIEVLAWIAAIAACVFYIAWMIEQLTR